VDAERRHEKSVAKNASETLFLQGQEAGDRCGWLLKQEARRSRRAIACPASAEAVQVTNNPGPPQRVAAAGRRKERRKENYES
jgi:hypothetical protein